MSATKKTNHDDEIMYEAKLSKNGQITLPAKFRTANDLIQGDTIKIYQNTANDEMRIELVKDSPKISWDELLENVPVESLKFNPGGTIDEKQSPTFAAWMRKDSDDDY